MKTLHYSIIAILLVTAFFGIQCVFAQNVANSTSISPAMPINRGGFIPDIYSDFFISGHILPNVAIPVGLDFTNTGNVTLYDVHIAFVNSSVLQNFKTNFGNFTLKVGQEKTILGTIYSPSKISNVSSSVNWMVYAKNQDGTVGSKEFHRSINLANKFTPEYWSSYPVILPPLQQGVTVDGIECKKELQLIIKLDDYSPACVRPSTNQTLIERGWGESMASLMEPPAIKKMEIIGLHQNYKIGQPIHVIIKYTGWVYRHEPDVKILDVNGTQIWFNCPECSLYATSYATIMASFFTTSYNVTDANGQYPIINKTGTYTMITSLGNETAEFNVIPVQQTSENTTLPASFEPCDTPYPQSNTGIAVLYMPANSIGKICVRYYNLNNTPTSIGMRIFEANNLTKNASNVTAWTDDSTLEGNVNKTIVYFIKTGTKVGFYGVSLNCGGFPFAVGYDINSTITASDFPWIGRAFHCGVITYDSHIEGTTGIGVKYIPYP
ncbi:MAG: hypothetical protein ACYC6W_02875 [Nitrosotalea sp.]